MTQSENSKEIQKPIYERIILKITGEAFSTFNRNVTEKIVDDIEKTLGLGVQIGLLVGGGNIVRGQDLKATQNINKSTADYMGMVATIINALWLGDILIKRKIEAVVQTAIEIRHLKTAGIAVEPYNPQKAVWHLGQGRIVILAGGTGEPLCTTDYAAVVRANELGAEAILKGTKMDGIHTADPLKEKKPRFIPEISYAELRRAKLNIIENIALDLALTGCVKKVPIHVFYIFKKGNLWRILIGEKIGSKIY